MYKIFSQKDKRWSEVKLGDSNCSVRDYGCYCVSLSCLTGISPDILIPKLSKAKCFNSEGALYSDKAAKVLGLKYRKLSPKSSLPAFPVICETNYYAPKVPQHFFLLVDNKNIVDPLVGKVIKNKYPIVSFRAFKKVA